MFLFIRPSFVANPQAAGRLIPPSPIFGRGEALGVAVAQNRQVNALPQPSVPLPLGLEGWTGKAQVCCIQNVGAKAERKQKCAGGESLRGAGLHAGGAFAVGLTHSQSSARRAAATHTPIWRAPPARLSQLKLFARHHAGALPGICARARGFLTGDGLAWPAPVGPAARAGRSAAPGSGARAVRGAR